MLLDILFALMMVLALYKGLKKGLIVAVFTIVGWVLGLFAAIKFSDAAAAYLKDSLDISPRWLSILSFVLVFMAVMLLMRIGAALVEKTVELSLMGWLNRIGGVFFYVLLYVLIFSVIIYFAEKVKLLPEDIASKSRVYGLLQPIVSILKQLL